MKPLDKELILPTARASMKFLSLVEEGGLGGFGAIWFAFCAEEGVLDAAL